MSPNCILDPSGLRRRARTGSRIFFLSSLMSLVQKASVSRLFFWSHDDRMALVLSYCDIQSIQWIVCFTVPCAILNGNCASRWDDWCNNSTRMSRHTYWSLHVRLHRASMQRYGFFQDGAGKREEVWWTLGQSQLDFCSGSPLAMSKRTKRQCIQQRILFSIDWNCQRWACAITYRQFLQVLVDTFDRKWEGFVAEYFKAFYYSFVMRRT